MTLRKNGTKNKPTEEEVEGLRTTASNRDKLAEERADEGAVARNAPESEDD